MAVKARVGVSRMSLPHRRFVLGIGAAVVLLVLSALVVAPRLGPALVVSRPVANPDAIVSLASHEWERLPAAAALASAHPDALVVLTVPSEVTPFNCHDCENRVNRLQHLGVNPERVRLIHLHHPGTYGEALAVLALAREDGLRRIVIVTSPYHTRRSLATFRHVLDGSGIETGVAPALETSPARPSRWLVEPYDLAYVAYELAAIVHYAWKYDVPLGIGDPAASSHVGASSPGPRSAG